MSFTNKSKYNPEENGKLADLLSLGKWKQGIVNRLGDMSIPNDALLDALNVDIDGFGNIKRRDGYTKILDGNCHSLFAFGNHVYFVKDKNFSRINENHVVENLITNFTHEKVYYVEVANELYFCSNNRTHKINKLGNVEAWGIKSPQYECEITVGAPGSGGFRKGTYRINYSYLYGAYETAVYPLDTVIEVPYDDFNIEAECIPTSQSTGANFYISSINGEELYLAKTGYSVEINLYDKGSKSPKQHSDGIPCLENLCFANGRIWGTKDDKIYFSNDRDYRQYNPALYLGVDSSDIIIFKAVDNGLYIVTELATYFMTVSNPEDEKSLQLTKIFDFSAIKGTLFQEDDKTVGWLSSEGYILGDMSGKLQNITKDKLDFSKNYKDGASLVVKKDGIHQVLFALQQDGEKSSLQTVNKDNQV